MYRVTVFGNDFTFLFENMQNIKAVTLLCRRLALVEV